MFAGGGQERHHEAERFMRAIPQELAAEPDSVLMARAPVPKTISTAALPAKPTVSAKSGSETASINILRKTKIRKARPKKRHRAVWAKAGTTILIISGGIFMIGLIVFLAGVAAFSYGLILLGEILMILSSLGLTIGLVVGAVSM